MPCKGSRQASKDAKKLSTSNSANVRSKAGKGLSQHKNESHKK